MKPHTLDEIQELWDAINAANLKLMEYEGHGKLDRLHSLLNTSMLDCNHIPTLRLLAGENGYAIYKMLCIRRGENIKCST